MDKGNDIYRRLQEHLDTLPVGYPATKSGVEIRILKRFFTPEEAQIATRLTITPETLETIHERFRQSGMSLEELRRALDGMARKGAITFTTRNGERAYRNSMLVVGFYEAQVDHLTPDLLMDLGRYVEEAFSKEMWRTKVNQLRTIPVQKSIPLPDTYPVDSYDNVRKLVESAEGQIAVANCICRQSNEMAGQKCSVTDLRESCLVLDGEQYISMGIGRPVGKAEALEVLEKAQQAGLVLQPLNAQRPDAICCCCGDCCGILRRMKAFPRPADYYASNFYAEIDPELCTGCQTCVDRCQLDAAYMSNGVAAINLDRCIGCGNCVVGCEYGAAHLNKKVTATVPPVDMEDLHRKILASKTAGADSA